MRKLSYHMNEDLLIYRYKNGSISTKDEEKLLEWVKSSDENRTYFKTYSQFISKLENQRLAFDGKAAFNKFIAPDKVLAKKRVLSLSPFMRIAAMLVLVLGIAFTISKVVPFNKTPKLVLLEADAIQEQVLPDNSVVTLRTGGALAYPKTFKGNVREVKLEGDAFFDVEKNKEKPFIVNIGEIVIEVLGTSFDVSEDKQHQLVTITVETGKVKVRCDVLNYEKILFPKEQCQIHLGDKALVEETKVVNDNHLGWLTGILDFKETSLEEVVSVLNKVYDKEIIIGTDSIKNCKLTTKINKYPQPDVMKMLEQTLNLQVVEDDKAYILIGEACQN